MRTLCFSHVSFTGFPLGPLERLRPLGRDRAPAEPAGPVLAALPAAPLPALAALAVSCSRALADCARVVTMARNTRKCAGPLREGVDYLAGLEEFGLVGTTSRQIGD